MPEVTIEVDGAPVPWGVAKRMGTGGSFIPARQAMQADLIRVEWRKLGQEFIEKGESIALELEFVVDRPKSHFGTGRNADVLKGSAPRRPTGRPDLSNLAKLVEDALTGTAWADDDQVVSIEAIKRYGHTKSDRARSVVTVTWDA